MDADRVIKRAKESWAFQDQPVLCRSCLDPVAVYGWDLEGDPIFDPVCPICVAKILLRQPTQDAPAPVPRRHCNRCYDAKPLHGLAWCGTCAIAANEATRGEGRTPEDRACADAFIDARARHFRDRMIGSGPA